MKEEIVTFDTAKLAREKGFNYRCHKFTYLIGEKIYDGEYLNHNKEVKKFISKISIPTQSLLQKWLREKHNCYIQISEDFYKNGINHLVQVLFYDKKGSNGYDYICDKKSTGMWGDNHEFPTYEEALEFGLQKALEKI
jgi:hypothetical protein